jgi:hypothetical protein
MVNPYPQGAVWRRWDLHVHTPDSFENSFGGWTKYLAALGTIQEVSVLGITDYFVIDGYRKIRELRAQGELKNFDLIVPNVELRLDTFVPKRSDGSKLRRLNYHVIFSDDLEPDVIEQQFLQALNFQIDGHPRSEPGERNLTRQAVQEAGRLVKKHQSEFAGDSDFAAGCKVLTFNLDQVRKVLERDCFMGKYLLFLAAENWDQIDWGGQDYLARRRFFQKSDGLFCGQRGTIDWCLGRKDVSIEAFIEEFGGLKPCVHGSDAHAIETICKPKDDKYCWIKADPTFEGLKQIIYEPADRVYVGPSAPVSHDLARVIHSITLSECNGWFPEGLEIPLNAGLTSIIGQKGSGKSALAELIAVASGSWDSHEPGSFIKRAGDHIASLNVKLTWADDTSEAVCIDDDPPQEEHKVRYLSQKFVEKLCAEDHLGGELVREIEAVMFAHTDPTDTLNASSFEELRAIRTAGNRADADRLREDIRRLIHEECALRDNAAKLPEKKARIKTLQEEDAGLKKQMPAAATPEEKRLIADLQAKRAQLATAQAAVGLEKQKLQKIVDIRTRVATFQSHMQRFTNEITTLLNDAGFPATDRAAFLPAFPSGMEVPLSRRTADIQTEIAKREGTAEKPAENTIRWLEQQIAKLAARESADKTRQERIKVIQTRIAAIATEIARLQKEIEQVEGPEHARVVAAKDERANAYVAYFDNLVREQETLEDLYKPAKKKLGILDTKHSQEIDFSIRWDADIDKWLSRGSVLFDQRKTLPYGTMQGLAEQAKKTLGVAWASGSSGKIKQALDEFLTDFKAIPPKNYLRSDATLQDVLNWIYEVDHVRLSYGLKYNGAELDKLSPGTKGIVLLILYLGMDISDTRPLVIDQPDENLDNESIFKLLKMYFRDAKARRQIILISHNPNLVVNADSEQLIVAMCDRGDDGLPRITYTMGALENSEDDGTGIRQHACRILEGGAEAFRNRESRYSLRPTIRA